MACHQAYHLRHNIRQRNSVECAEKSQFGQTYRGSKLLMQSHAHSTDMFVHANSRSQQGKFANSYGLAAKNGVCNRQKLKTYLSIAGEE